MHKMKIIVAVLNWGLGHASRSIPVITALKAEGFEPVLASDGEALLLLRKDFPELEWDTDLMVGLCKPCHSAATRREQANRKDK